IEDRTIQIYGDGSQLRDFVYVDDAADAFLRAGAEDRCNGEAFNVGGDRPISLRDLTRLLVEVAGSGRVEYVEWPADKKAIGIGTGDEVITTPLSAAYSALAVMMAGARPVFADIDPARLTIDPGAAARAIGPRTRAILPVHLYGQSADMTAIERIASRHDLAIVEDCCQAHLATAAGRPAGTIGV